MEFKVVNKFPEVDVEEFEDLLASNDFNQQLEKLPNVEKRELLEEKDLGGGKRHTVTRYMTKALPEPAKRIFGSEGVGFTEEVDFNRNTHVHHFKIIPHIMKDRAKCDGKYTIEPLGPDGGTRRIVTVNVKIKAPLGMGRLAERLVKRLFEANARDEERVAREYIRDHLDEIKGKKKKPAPKKSAAKKTSSKKKK